MLHARDTSGRVESFRIGGHRALGHPSSTGRRTVHIQTFCASSVRRLKLLGEHRVLGPPISKLSNDAMPLKKSCVNKEKQASYTFTVPLPRALFYIIPIESAAS